MSRARILYYLRNAAELSPERRKHLATLTTPGGSMRPWLRSEPAPADRVVLAYHHGEVIGWALSRPCEKRLDVFVSPQWRRVGIGHALIVRAIKHTPEVRRFEARPWSVAGDCLFARFPEVDA